MGVSRADADDWDLVEYRNAKIVWNDRHKTEDDEGDTEPPPIEWMIADDVRLSDRGIKVH